MASVNGATCAMCIKSPAMFAEYSPGDYQQRIRRFKIKRPFNLKIDIDQKEFSCLHVGDKEEAGSSERGMRSASWPAGGLLPRAASPNGRESAVVTEIKDNTTR